MSATEGMTIILPPDVAAVVERAIDGGEYASGSEVVAEAVRDWEAKRALAPGEFEALKVEIDRGLADVANGRVHEFDAGRIIEHGRKLLAGRSRSV